MPRSWRGGGCWGCLTPGWWRGACSRRSGTFSAGAAAGSGIKDYDLFYFDGADLSEAGERRAQARADAALGDLGVTVEVANQARVHLWYPGHFGRPYPPLGSSQDGIRRFLVLETCVGVRPGEVHAPYGLDGIHAGTLTPNPLTPYPELFEAKAASYRARWPHLMPIAKAGHDADPKPASMAYGRSWLHCSSR